MQHIVSLSGGKDSTALLLMMLEKGMQVDRVINVDTTKEFPEMYEHLKKLEKYVGIPFEIVTLDFDYHFYQHVKTRGKNKGEVGYGWPDFRNRWCTTMKTEAFKRQAKKKELISDKKIDRVKEPYIEYHGIAFDEPKRIKSVQNIKYPLFDWKITEDEALQYCYDKGFDWGGLYAEGRKRVSCYCCPLQRIGELRLTWKHHKDLWKDMQRLDKYSKRRFRAEYSLEQLEAKFEKEID